MINLKRLLKEKYFIKIKDYDDLSLIDFSDNKVNYSENFFEEYKRYPKLQLDSFNKLDLNEVKFYDNSLWGKEELNNKDILEIGSGAGKFTEILLKTNCNLITADINDSIKINYENNFKNNSLNKVCFIKNNVNEIIFKEKTFDFIILYGVLQNANNQEGIIKDCISLLKKGGKLTLDVTRASNLHFHLLNPKYFWRIFFTKMSSSKIFKIVNFLVPKFIPVDTYLKKNLGFLGRIISKIFFPFPLINYFFLPLKKEIKLKMSVLDTFDALASQYDKPLTKMTLKKIIKNVEIELGLNLEKINITEKKGLIIVNIIS